MSLTKCTASLNTSAHAVVTSMLILVASILSWACQDTALDPLTLSFKFGSCLGELQDEQSCSSRIFSSIPQSAIGCWVIRSERVEEITYQSLMRWDGRSLNLAQAESAIDFPFNLGNEVSMSLFVFDMPVGAGACSALEVTSSCATDAGCRARLTRRGFRLQFGVPIDFQDDRGQCLVSAPQHISRERCDEVDNDCDGQIDETLTCSSCSEGDARSCETVCGVGIERCQMGNYQGCDAPQPRDEVCGGVDEDCDGELDEGLSCSVCVEGDERACDTECGSGLERCLMGSYRGCDAPQPRIETCGGRDEDCDGSIDEGLECDVCITGSRRPCETECGVGEELCQDGVYLGCDAPQPSMEICSDVDEDCDGQIDETLNCGGCVEGDRRPCENQCGVGEEECIDEIYQGCNAPIPQPEFCDLIDNDCDGEVDEETLRGTSCIRQYEGCLGDFPGVYLCTPRGEECLAEVPSQDQEEVCDGLDNNCDGFIDNHALNGVACRGEVEGCAYSQHVCPANVELGVEQELICEGPLTPPLDVCGDAVDNDCDGEIDEGTPEVCDGVDNNCNAETDEGSVCGRLLYDHCWVSLGWAVLEMTPMSAPWAQFPSLPGQATCTPRSDIDTNEYSCNVAEAQSGFRTVNITTDLVGEGHWLGLAWDCDATAAAPSLEQDQVDLIEWAQSHCVIGLGYWDSYLQPGSWELGLNECGAFSIGDDDNRQRCVKTNATGQYVGIELEGEVDGNDRFGIAFACADDTGDVPPSMSERLQEEFRIFLGTQQDEPSSDRLENWNNIPNDDIDNGGDRRGAGSLSDGSFNMFELRDNRRLYQFSIYTHLEE